MCLSSAHAFWCSFSYIEELRAGRHHMVLIKPVSAVFNEQAGCLSFISGVLFGVLRWYMIYGHTQELGMFFFAGSSTWIWTKVFTEMFYFLFFLNSILLKTSAEAHRGRKIAEEVRVPAELSCEFSKCILQLYLVQSILWLLSGFQPLQPGFLEYSVRYTLEWDTLWCVQVGHHFKF